MYMSANKIMSLIVVTCSACIVVGSIYTQKMDMLVGIIGWGLASVGYLQLSFYE